jgi:hypothetical protein
MLILQDSVDPAFELSSFIYDHQIIGFDPNLTLFGRDFSNLGIPFG